MRFSMMMLLCLLCRALEAQPLDVHESSIAQLNAAMESGRMTSVQLVDQYLARIQAYDDAGPGLNSLIRINPLAREQAAGLDAERAQGRIRGPLHGVPVIIKDNYNTDFMPTTGASVALAGFQPTENATAVRRLLDAGAVILAKSNLHEFAYGITSISSLGGQTRNPYDPRRVPGGSSGGTSAAIAASLAAVGMGSDTCGSIRIPSAFNNLVGLRPSKGLTSIRGVMPLSHTQDVTGPLARSVEDLAVVLDVIAGFDAADPDTAIARDAEIGSFVDGLDSRTLTGLRLGRLEGYFADIEPAMNRVLDQAMERLRAQGVEIVDVEIPDLTAMLAGSGVIGHEFRTDLNQYLSEFGSAGIDSLAEVLEFGLFHQAVEGVLDRSSAAVLDEAAYQAALARRQQLREVIENLLESENLDALIYPPITRLQVFAGENQPGNNCSLSANSGLPAIAMPAGFTDEGLPVGLELLGRFLDDVKLVSLAWQWEQVTAPRQAPFTTPPLVNGAAPPAMRRALPIQSGPVSLEVEITLDQTRASFGYRLSNSSAEPSALYAVTLVSDEPADAGLSDPVVANLSGPGQLLAEGDLYLTSRLRRAWQEQRLYLKVFGRDLPVEGVAILIPGNQ